MNVAWAEAARRDLDQIVLHIAEDNIDAALRMQDRIEAAAARLAAMPLRARVGRVDGTRELMISRSPYVVVFRVVGDAVAILRILHGA